MVVGGLNFVDHTIMLMTSADTLNEIPLDTPRGGMHWLLLLLLKRAKKFRNGILKVPLWEMTPFILQIS